MTKRRNEIRLNTSRRQRYILTKAWSVYNLTKSLLQSFLDLFESNSSVSLVVNNRPMKRSHYRNGV